jgi:uncharacterized membrane protein YbhN (UPF0104 family)
VAGFTSVSVTEVAGVLASGQMEWLLLSAVLYGAAHVISALVWREGLSAAGLRSLPLGQVMRAHWICRGASEFLPAQLGEIARVAALKNRPEISGRVLRVVGSIGAFKVVDGGLSLIVAVVIVGVLAAPLLPGLTTIAIVVATIIVALLGVVVLWRSRDSVFPLRIRAAFEELAVGVGLLRGDHPVAPAFALQSTAIVLRMLSLAALLPAYGAPVSAAPMMFALLILTGLLPISPGGAGVREAAVVPVLIVSYGVGLETALAVSLATQAVGLAVSLLGAGIALAVGTRVGVTPAPAPTPQPV